MRLAHVALYVASIEKIKEFYQEYFSAEPSEMYHNQKTGLKTYFLAFQDGGSLEIMARPDATPNAKELKSLGYTHIAFCVDGKENVDKLTDRLQADGYSVINGPRITGDGYYESCVLDPEGNQIEIVA